MKCVFQEKAAGEMLAVAAAVGVAGCFGAPVSGERSRLRSPEFYSSASATSDHPTPAWSPCLHVLLGSAPTI